MSLTASTASQSVRVLIVDDHAVMCAGLRMLIEKHPDFTVIGTALNRSDALAIAAREQPDLILLDLDLGGGNALDFLPELLEATHKAARVLILTGVRDPDMHRRAFSLGAVGLVMKEQASEVLLRAIEKVNGGEVWIERSMMASLLVAATQVSTAATNPDAATLDNLTEREREIISYICQGMKNQKIADALFITVGTVRNHLNSIFSKLRVSDRLELAVYAYEHGLAKPQAVQHKDLH